MRLAYWRPPAYAVLFVVASFIATLWYSQHRLRLIERYVEDLATNAAPSVNDLAAARGYLRELAFAATQFTEGNGDDPRLGEEMARTRRLLGETLDRYRQLPFFPNERVLYDEVERRTRSLDSAYAAELAEPTRAHHRELYAAIDSVDDAVEQVIAFDARQVQLESSQILSSKRHANATALAFGGLSIGLSIVALLLAWRSLRQQALIVEDYQRLLESRASELEAFSSRVAHDLKNPVAAMALRMVVAEQGGLVDEKLAPTFARLKKHVASMHTLIDGLLAFALAGARPQPGAHAAVASALDDVLSEIRPPAEELRCELIVEPFQPAEVACSSAALASVLGNLLRNAVKFIPDGKSGRRCVTVSVIPRGSRVRIEVDDTGPGLPLGSEQRVFEPFVRLSDGKKSGIGLGLATVKRLVEAHGGRVGAANTDHGARFFVDLPIYTAVPQ
jgi:signal transduction histidine kinase